MSTDTAKITQQERWVLMDTDVSVGFREIHDKVLVRIPLTVPLDDFGKLVEEALSDPSRVLNVDAYPAVVEALKDILGLATVSRTKNPRDVMKQAHAALAAVNPVEGAKT